MNDLFDIPADLDTPVSAYLKLAPFGRRFLLESVGGSGREARYSLLGFGQADEFVMPPEQFVTPFNAKPLRSMVTRLVVIWIAWVFWFGTSRLLVRT